MDRRFGWVVTCVAMLTMTVSYVDRTALAVLAPSVKDALHIDATDYGVLTAVFSIAYLVATPLSGWLLDRVGARRGLAASVLAWSLVSALHALAPSFAVLLVLRLMLGIAEGPGFPGTTQAVSRSLSAAARPRGLGMLFAGSALGSTVAPPLASWLFGIGGWQFAFVGTALAGLAWVPLWIGLTRIPEIRGPLDRSAPTPGRAPLVSVLVQRPVIRAMVAILGIAPLFTFVQAWAPLYLVNVHGIKQVEVGHFLWLPPIFNAIGAFGFGDIAARLGRPRWLLMVAAAIGTAIALLPYASSPWEATWMMSISMIGGGGMYTLVTSEMLAGMPADRISVASGTLAGAQSIAFIIANPLIGAALDRWQDYGPITTTIAGWIVPTAVAWFVIDTPRRSVTTAGR